VSAAIRVSGIEPMNPKYYQLAKAALNPLTYAEVCRRRAQSGLDTRVVYAVNDEYWVLNVLIV